MPDVETESPKKHEHEYSKVSGDLFDADIASKSPNTMDDDEIIEFYLDKIRRRETKISTSTPVNNRIQPNPQRLVAFRWGEANHIYKRRSFATEDATMLLNLCAENIKKVGSGNKTLFVH